MVDFGKRLKKLRLQRDLTQLMLANKLGITKSVISAYETGTRMPSYDILLSIANMFSVSTDYLLGNDMKTTLDLSGLDKDEQKAIRQLVNAIKKG